MALVKEQNYHAGSQSYSPQTLGFHPVRDGSQYAFKVPPGDSNVHPGLRTTELQEL